MALLDFNSELFWRSLSVFVQECKPSHSDKFDYFLTSLRNATTFEINALSAVAFEKARYWHEVAVRWDYDGAEMDKTEREIAFCPERERFELEFGHDQSFFIELSNRFSTHQPIRALERVKSLLAFGEVQTLNVEPWDFLVPIWNIVEYMAKLVDSRKDWWPDCLTMSEWKELIFAIDEVVPYGDGKPAIGRPAESLEWQELPDGFQANGRYLRGVYCLEEPAWLFNQYFSVTSVVDEVERSQVKLGTCNFIEDWFPGQCYREPVEIFRCTKCGFRTTPYSMSWPSQLRRVCKGPSTTDDLASIMMTRDTEINFKRGLLEFVWNEADFQGRAENSPLNLSDNTLVLLSRAELESSQRGYKASTKLIRSIVKLAMSKETDRFSLYALDPNPYRRSRAYIVEERFRRCRIAVNKLMESRANFPQELIDQLSASMSKADRWRNGNASALLEPDRLPDDSKSAVDLDQGRVFVHGPSIGREIPQLQGKDTRSRFIDRHFQDDERTKGGPVWILYSRLREAVKKQYDFELDEHPPKEMKPRRIKT